MAARVVLKIDQCVRARLLAGLSVRQAAIKLDVTPQHLHYIEKSERRPSPALLRRMADTYGVPMDMLFTIAEDAA